MQNTAALNMKLPQRLYDDLKEAAEKKNISMAALVRIILTEYLEQQK